MNLLRDVTITFRYPGERKPRTLRALEVEMNEELAELGWIALRPTVLSHEILLQEEKAEKQLSVNDWT